MVSLDFEGISLCTYSSEIENIFLIRFYFISESNWLIPIQESFMIEFDRTFICPDSVLNSAGYFMIYDSEIEVSILKVRLVYLFETILASWFIICIFQLPPSFVMKGLFFIDSLYSLFLFADLRSSLDRIIFIIIVEYLWRIVFIYLSSI